MNWAEILKFGDRILIQTPIIILLMVIVFMWGYVRGLEDDAKDYFNWTNGWDAAINAIKEGISENAQNRADTYVGYAPDCFGHNTTPNGEAENGCYDCKYNELCIEMRREVNSNE